MKKGRSGASWVAGQKREEQVLCPFKAGVELTRRFVEEASSQVHIMVNGQPLTSFRRYVSC